MRYCVRRDDHQSGAYRAQRDRLRSGLCTGLVDPGAIDRPAAGRPSAAVR
jgi:hypothetical protein